MKVYMNQAIIAGNLGADAETRHLPSGSARTTFSVATTRKWKGQDGQQQEATTWHNIVMWDGAEWLIPLLRKGAAVLVTGRIETRSYDDQKTGEKRYITEIVADRYMGVQPLVEREAQQQRVSRPQASGSRGSGPSTHTISDDEELPF